MFYLLEGHEAVRCSMDDYIEWLSKGDRVEDSRVGGDRVGNTFISTVFLSTDCNCGFGEPQLFETAVFDGPNIGQITRYPTWEAAESGHQQILKHEREKHGEQIN